MDTRPRVVLVMGVSGCGKSTVAKGIAEATGGHYFDADDFHPPENIEKMSAGYPLDDSDREPWLARLRRDVVDAAPQGEVTVLACSALKRHYRDALVGGVGDAAIVFLDGSYELIENRMRERPGHYMKAGMLRSQFEALEVPQADEAALRVDIGGNINEVISAALGMLVGGVSGDRSRPPGSPTVA